MGSRNFNEWGPKAWAIFHEKAIRYPKNPCKCDIKKILHFYNEKFMEYIGCESCKKDYKKIICRNPARANSQTDLFMWTVDIHNIVNLKLGKEVISYNEAFRIWTRMNLEKSYKYNRCCDDGYYYDTINPIRCQTLYSYDSDWEYE
ncbi:Alr family protein [Tupanvirus soda lake]|uniref:Sulfhydryl oxidase n=2 Tax=Tupanvirus TaxID=2094720 RepID=A0A6N1P2S4_9VIRU|nr:Alr family protein [Tupanvirus soda lake]QKU35321.1 Alr family protein [Tupanvirus soda lake]